jgi:hypothetical protein
VQSQDRRPYALGDRCIAGGGLPGRSSPRRCNWPGAGLSPLVTGALELPALSLVEVKDIDGNAKSAAPVSIPDDPKNPAASHTRWMGQMADSSVSGMRRRDADA